MDLTLIATHFSDITWVLFALFFGLVVTFISLPPMVGYLIAGFVLSAMGLQGGETLNAVAEIGVTILLFSIGLKLNIKDLFRTEIWAVSVIHMLLTTVIFGALIFAMSFSALQEFIGLSVTESALIAFALSFSSTVFAVKTLEESGEMSSLHGKIAIGILIMQDLFAVIFLTVTSGKVPSYWAVLLLLLIPLRPVLIMLLKKVGHGELLILSGMLLALGGAALFDFTGVKADLGALLIGVLLAGNEKSDELAKSLLAFKEIFLVAFFLSVGFNGVPSVMATVIAIVLAIVMLGKAYLFFKLFTRFKLRARTSFLTSLSLSNYSEFGLIVGFIGVSNGWMSGEWLVIIAVALSITFTMSSLANTKAHSLYAKYELNLHKSESIERLTDDKPIDAKDAQVLIFGMGRVGTGAYDTLVEQYGDSLLGVDFDQLAVDRNIKEKRNVILGDATDYDFWARLKPGAVKLIILDMPNVKEALAALEMIKLNKYEASVAATVKHNDCMNILKESGVDIVFNIYSEAGSGFANHVIESIDQK
ncbi:MAG: potassium transporter Kef [endosymbiont of Galathealinum brachiosum]|uniref:Potassium transporter Kef n=1 Tax=endosymbiont of Galathealinum brachiosum TaxID=2200906 RepID=A0A370D7T6_9GAMM|nr:MAG: potassium transporter Kef [endosymbiont of Galathealinum brachiosum]